MNLNIGEHRVVSGPRPAAPFNVSVLQTEQSLVIKWNISRHAAGVPVEHYVIQYRTVGQWVPLSSSVPANRTWYRWGTASRGALYHFRVFAVSKQAHSDPSVVVSLRTGGETDLELSAVYTEHVMQTAE